MILLSLDPQGRITSVNRNFEEEMGYRAADLLGRPLEALIPEHVKPLDFFKRVSHAITRGEHMHGVIRLLRGNGREAWLRSILQPVRNAAGKVQSISIHASDLTRTIENSREHENLIHALQRSTAVIEFDLEGVVLDANDRFLQGMGYSKNQLIGKHHQMFCEHEEVASPQYQVFWDKLRRGDPLGDGCQEGPAAAGWIKHAALRPVNIGGRYLVDQT
ncbi:hypothetical protein STW0522PSE72_P20310 (plasmid) [Pseudomonas monteilii]|nr:hypothetical protein STW0522PSE72_P20310 [Pseudomonas monteilii]